MPARGLGKTRRRGTAALGAAFVLLTWVVWPAVEGPAQADASAPDADAIDYASPLELLVSPDGARLYVLCQQAKRSECSMQLLLR